MDALATNAETFNPELELAVALYRIERPEDAPRRNSDNEGRKEG